MRASKDDSFGYNALTDTYENLVQAGVIDPTKVTRTALVNAKRAIKRTVSVSRTKSRKK